MPKSKPLLDRYQKKTGSLRKIFENCRFSQDMSRDFFFSDKIEQTDFEIEIFAGQRMISVQHHGVFG